MAGIGEALRSTRERRGLSIDEVARETRISPRFLEALEAEAFDELPAPVYVRGFLRSYANYLKIEPQPLLDRLVGGDVAMPQAAGGYVGGNARNLQNLPRRNDPFQRSGVAAAPPVPGTPRLPQAEPPGTTVEDDSWSPEPLAPFTPPHQDHGYVPGSDLMEAPEYRQADDYPYEEYAEPEPAYRPRFDRRQAGVLAERPGGPSDPGTPRRLIALAGGVFAVLAFLAAAVLLTRSDGNGNVPANAAGGDSTPQVTPGTVIALGTRTPAPSPSVSTTAGASATVSATASATTTPGTSTPSPTPGAGTPTATPTTGTSPTTAPTQAPTATPTSAPPTATPTTFVPPPHPLTYSACDTSRETNKCGSETVRVICFPPFAETSPSGKNDNYFVDVTGNYPLQSGWREVWVSAPVSIGPVIDAGRSGCL